MLEVVKSYSPIIVALITIIGGWFFNKKIEGYRSEYVEQIENLKSSNKKQEDMYKNELEKQKAMFLRYSDHQFKSYNELWFCLYELKVKADKLWVAATKSNLRSFANQLNKTKESVGKSILLLEDGHYDKLVTLIDAFSNFQIGKENLIKLRELENNNLFTIEEWQIQNLVNANYDLVNEYSNLLKIIGVELKKQIRG